MKYDKNDFPVGLIKSKVNVFITIVTELWKYVNERYNFLRWKKKLKLTDTFISAIIYFIKCRIKVIRG